MKYTYQRKDGGTTDCYGELRQDSNFSIVCEDEMSDGIWTDNESLTTWQHICKYLEKNYNSKIEELTAI
jgi:hypothetical protein